MNLTAGIDLGARNAKAVILEGKRLLAKAIVPGGPDVELANAVLVQALENAGLQRKSLHKIAATGAGASQVPDADRRITEVTALSFGAFLLYPQARSVLDVGGEDARCVLCDADGSPIDFLANDRCAAGSGIFIETVARALEISPGDFDRLYFATGRSAAVNSQCVVFAESEVVSLVHQNVPREEIVRATIDAVAQRSATLTRKLKAVPPILLCGGMALYQGFAKSLSQILGCEIISADQPQFVVAAGAALLLEHSF